MIAMDINVPTPPPKKKKKKKKRRECHQSVRAPLLGFFCIVRILVPLWVGGTSTN